MIQWDFIVVQWDFIVIQQDINGIYPLVMSNIATENGPVEIADLTINSMVIFNSYTGCALFGGLEHELYDFPYIGNVIIPTEFHILRRA